MGADAGAKAPHRRQDTYIDGDGRQQGDEHRGAHVRDQGEERRRDQRKTDAERAVNQSGREHGGQRQPKRVTAQLIETAHVGSSQPPRSIA